MLEQMTELLASNRLDPTTLTLEVTESALMGELVTSLDILTRLRLKGVRLSIDDFGTGYSSLSQLHRIPATELKIDYSFVAGMVEDPEARNFLSNLECDIAQGYFIGKPMPGDELVGWVKNQRDHMPRIDKIKIQ